jgi:hypothetical protein
MTGTNGEQILDWIRRKSCRSVNVAVLRSGHGVEAGAS